MKRPAPQGSRNTDTVLTERLAYSRAIVDWCFRAAASCAARDQFNESLAWNGIAARVLATGCNPLVSVPLERNLLDLARRLPPVVPTRVPGSRRRWLHVIDRALPWGGHTAMARRWIEADRANVHSVALTAQETPVPEALVAAVFKSGGEILTATSGAPPLERAAWLRRTAAEIADCVVLHIDTHNVIPTVAFGVEGGPPVLLVNHAAHTFWTGASIADLVLNCRGSELERSWTERLRGIAWCATLPIPLSAGRSEGDTTAATLRWAARKQLDLPDHAPVLLSIGDGYKYTPIQGRDFLEAAERILERCPEAYMVVLGSPCDARWKAANARLGGRLRAFGRQHDVSVYHAAADVYLEGFPFGSTTALLEAGLAGLPAVLAPGECPPPFGTDGVATDAVLVRPANIEKYISRAQELVENATERSTCGRKLAASVSDHHTGAGWLQYLGAVAAAVPDIHSVHPLTIPQAPAKAIEHYWAEFRAANLEGDALTYPFDTALRAGLTPRMDPLLFKACRKARQVRQNSWLSLPVLAAFNTVLPLCSRARQWQLYAGFREFLKRAGKVRKHVRTFVNSLLYSERLLNNQDQRSVGHAMKSSGF